MIRHEATADHKISVAAPKLNNNMTVAINNAKCKQDEAIIKTLKLVNWLACENVPLSKFESLMNLLKELGVPGLGSLNIGDRINYNSYYTANELLEAISDVLDGKTTTQLKESPDISLFADESTDIANKKRMTMTARIVDPSTSIMSSVFLTDIEYADGTGEGLSKEIFNEMDRRGVPFNKVAGFGSDGASVMTGLGKGVTGRLKELNPHILNIHCIAHRLALCTSQAAEGIKSLKRYQDWMTSLFYYFKASATREKELHEIQGILDHPKLRYKEVHAVQWLSFYEALASIYRTIDPLITYMHNHEAQNDPKAKGLLKQLATTGFIYTTHMMMDVLPIVSKL